MKFSPANTKLKKLEKKTGKRVFSFDLLSGHTCPGAKDCLAMVLYDWATDQYSLHDGPDQQFRCYSASQEMQYTGAYNHRLANWESIEKLNSTQQIACQLEQAMPKKAEIVRIHTSGDFFQKRYFLAWISVASNHPDMVFYAYTKMNPLWIRYRTQLPNNLILTASRGGKFDHLIEPNQLREVMVVKFASDSEAISEGFPEEVGKTAEALGLEIDSDDSHASNPAIRSKNFAILIHGQGQAGSDQAKIHTMLTKTAKKALTSTGD